MRKSYVVAIDQGTTSSRAIFYDVRGRVVSQASQEFRQYYPRPGWVEHDANEILASVKAAARRAMEKAHIKQRQVSAIGITNQRETIVLWARKSGQPFGRAIVWQDRRTEAICTKLKQAGYEREVRKKTGIFFDPYFSGTKLKWCFDHSDTLRRKARAGSLCFGTIDSWLLYHLTGRRTHATDFTNASRTLLFDLRRKRWDPSLCRMLHVPASILPDACPSNSVFGVTKKFAPFADGTPVTAILGDQQAALYGQACYRPGDSKNTYGTGCFLLVNTGSRMIHSHSGLVSTLACDRQGDAVYALEASIFIGGAVIQWLRDELKVIRKAADADSIARKTKVADPIVLIPGFTGLGAPYWRPDVRGAIFGITRGTTRNMLIKAAVESIALQVKDVFDVMRRESNIRIRALKVDGGATANNYLMQLQADLLGVPILRTSKSESTAWGVAKLAGLKHGLWSKPELLDRSSRYERFIPHVTRKRTVLIKRWREAIARLTS